VSPIAPCRRAHNRKASGGVSPPPGLLRDVEGFRPARPEFLKPGDNKPAGGVAVGLAPVP
jgi:hypothetical protein